MTDELAAARREIETLRDMLDRATVRLGILRDRMEACHETHPTEHNVSLIEVPFWIDEQRAALEGKR